MIALEVTGRERDLIVKALDLLVSEAFVDPAEGDPLADRIRRLAEGSPLDAVRAYLEYKDAAFDENALGDRRFRCHVTGKPDPVAGIADPTNPLYPEGVSE